MADPLPVGAGGAGCRGWSGSAIPTCPSSDGAAQLDELITRCLAKDPADRPGSAIELRDALAAITATRPTRVERPARPAQQSPAVVLAVSMLVLAPLVVLAVVLFFGGR